MKAVNLRLLQLLLATTLTIAFAACGDDEPQNTQPERPDPVTPTDTTKDETPEPTPTVQTCEGWPAEYGGVMLQGFY